MTIAERIDPDVAVDQDALTALVEGRHGDPFSFLGPHPVASGMVVRTFQPGARTVEVLEGGTGRALAPLQLIHPAGVFAGRLPERSIGGEGQPGRVQDTLVIGWADGSVQETEDPYAFGPLLGELDLYLLGEGTHLELSSVLGAHAGVVEGVHGVRFAVWAPNAQRVSLVGDFNAWDGRRHPMRLRQAAGIWEIFIPRIGVGARYKFEILGRDGTVLPLKADPVARAAELPPATASIVADPTPFRWTDDAWMAQRAQRQSAEAAISIYEVHPGSWMRIREDGGRSPDWEELGDRLIPYTAEMGFTHIELMPIMEHPFGGSWGYQPLGMFAPTARFGSPHAFARFIDRCHEAGIGVLLDWVPAHFPSDAHGLAEFDGTALYEHADPREGFHHDWNTLIYNFGRSEVSGFLVASALEWLRHFHVDGLRVDAVASMLYRDYSRKPGEWVPNIHGGRENLEAVAFLRRLNEVIHAEAPGAIVMAEESTAWPGVTAPVQVGGLGFSFKWNMGWMHDTLRYIGHETIHRRYHHSDMTFGLVYAFSERFVLPISHDEVVHGKGSLLDRMPGDQWQRMANMRAYLGFMWGHPGKKLLFMGCEIAQPTEWNHDGEIPWDLLDQPFHRGMQKLVRDLNGIYTALPALHGRDAMPDGFAWVVGDDVDNSVFAFFRFAPGAAPVLVVSNMTPVPRNDYRIGVPEGGRWSEVLNSDAAAYGGSGIGNLGGVEAQMQGSHGQPFSLMLNLPPLSTLFLTPGPTA
ncbi:1,4-alpha-glucan branching protein GlgB [Azorhizobium sp. AG788]|uniref:1,4-alpha-glucan branching protein GlgB n=1 Tax=Azorhizobium sp. AG788 TaxID=2183897 RepID=UPI00313A28E2